MLSAPVEDMGYKNIVKCSDLSAGNNLGYKCRNPGTGVNQYGHSPVPVCSDNPMKHVVRMMAMLLFYDQRMSLGVNVVGSRAIEEIHGVDLHVYQFLEIEGVPFPVIAFYPEYDDAILHLLAADDLLHMVHGTGLSLINLSVPDVLWRQVLS